MGVDRCLRNTSLAGAAELKGLKTYLVEAETYRTDTEFCYELIKSSWKHFRGHKENPRFRKSCIFLKLF